ncbi:Fe2OG dioxygenase domain-containing protein, partial [Trichostrongylus colubriformis]
MYLPVMLRFLFYNHIYAYHFRMQYVLFLMALLLVTTHADVFTSIADMQALLHSEKSIFAILTKYIENEENRLEHLKNLIKARNEEAMKMDIKDFTNPVNAFLFIKKKIFNWKRIEQAVLMNNPRSFLESIAQKNYGFRYPTQEDLTGAAMGLLRLQDTYKLDTTELADGRIYKTQGNYTFSDPDHPRARGNVKFYEDLLAKGGVKMADMKRSIGRIVNQRPASVLGNEERVIYEALCRNEVPVIEKDISKLYCYYKRDRPYLVYAPIKVEIKGYNPLAVLFKDVISDEEIRVLEELAIPRLARAAVHDSSSGKRVHATYRISKRAWLGGWEHEVADRLNKRIDMMTNLEMATAEPLQVQNYGIGGHYRPHFDYVENVETASFKLPESGNRIATVLFY